MYLKLVTETLLQTSIYPGYHLSNLLSHTVPTKCLCINPSFLLNSYRPRILTVADSALNALAFEYHQARSHGSGGSRWSAGLHLSCDVIFSSRPPTVLRAAGSRAARQGDYSYNLKGKISPHSPSPAPSPHLSHPPQTEAVASPLT